MKRILILLLSILCIATNAQTYQKIKVNEIDTKDSSFIKLLKPLKFPDLTLQPSAVTSALFSNWNSAYNLSHAHNNLPLLQSVTVDDTTRWGLTIDTTNKWLPLFGKAANSELFAGKDTNYWHIHFGGNYTLPIASDVVLGGIKVGSGLSINGSGVLSAIGESSMTSSQIIDSISNNIELPGTFKVPFTKPLGYIQPYQLSTNLILTPDTLGSINGASTTYQILGLDGYKIYHRGDFSPVLGGESDTVITTISNKLYTFLGGCFGTGIYKIIKFNVIDSIIAPGVLQLFAPSDFEATTLGSNEINLSWTLPSPNGRYFEIYDSIGGVSSDYSLLHSPSKTETSYNHTGLSDGQHVYYKIRTIGNGVDTLTSSYATANATTQEVLFSLQTTSSTPATFNPSATLSAGTLYWDMGDGTNQLTNSPSIVYPDASTKTLNVFKGSASGASAITSLNNFNNKALVGTLDLSNLTNLSGEFTVASNTGLQHLTMPTTSGVFTSVTISSSGLIDANFSGCSKLGGTFYAISLPSMTSISLPTSTQLFTDFQIRDTQVESLDLSGLNLSEYIYCFNNTTMDVFILPTITHEFQGVLISNSSVDVAYIDAIYAKLNTYYSSHTPTKNLTINTAGGTNAAPTGGDTNTDIVNLQSIFSGAGKTLTITKN